MLAWVPILYLKDILNFLKKRTHIIKPAETDTSPFVFIVTLPFAQVSAYRSAQVSGSLAAAGMMGCIRLAAPGNQQHRQADKAKMSRTGPSHECERASMSTEEDSSLGESWDLQQSRWNCKYSRFQAVPSVEVISMRRIFLQPEFLPLLLLFVTAKFC
jgi:hypothetical protein